jgi:hypothetical protein
VFDWKLSEELRNNTFAVQLKKFYRRISTLETRILDEDPDDGGPEAEKTMLKDKGAEKQK